MVNLPQKLNRQSQLALYYQLKHILLGQIDGSAVVSHQPYWAVRAHLLARLRRGTEAVEAYDRAIGLSEDDAVRRFLLGRRSEAWAEA